MKSVRPSHLAWVRWYTENRPEWGWRSLTFPITVHDGPWARCYYHAFSFWFAGPAAGDRERQGYTGLLAWDGVQYAKFSAFGDGVEPIDTAHCWNSADGGSGCSCEVELPHVPGREYLYTVENDSLAGLHGGDERIWHGWCTDPVTGREDRIGTWRVPEGFGGLDSEWTAFHEAYTHLPDCSALPYTRVTFGEPYSVPDHAQGRLGDAYESPMSRCQGACGFDWWREPAEHGGVTVETGFRDRHRPLPRAGGVDVQVDVRVTDPPRTPPGRTG
ncbi:hypothetical protein [Saccharothrix sp. HUAS TT1]|uniref:hypothetical protein n=1 Tax=unclassified Saccharothrix TaxID=2593673 RepID=UPI00345B8793